jgi:hypothetical protein
MEVESIGRLTFIESVANNRVSKVMEVNSQLVGSAGCGL